MTNELGSALRAEARAAGFDDVGICSASTPLPWRAELDDALSSGRFDVFSWMQGTKDQRLDVKNRMAAAKSVVVVVQSYWQGDHRDHVDDDVLARSAKVSRYAWGADYHHVLRRKLRRLRKWLIARVPEAKVAPFNDVDAVAERAWAVACGLGFIGKSGMFISQSMGTWTFLGGLITDVALVDDHEAVPQVRPSCGSCTACLEACPTQAITSPQVVDPLRCLTTWNIEEPTDPRGDAFPGSGWAVGCDVCQEVCPWNKFAIATSEERYRPRHVVIDPAAPPDDVTGTPLARPGLENLVALATRALKR
ncbi:MAG: tRNA epoxyqueuosine(34) reductase QueG [Deltaproteobacteria bacterium]|nr:tRNA epoxyqueuosine(34) reductase QueG [Deltaproteobacteria bacterium]